MLAAAAAAAAAAPTTTARSSAETYRWWRTKDRQPQVKPDGVAKQVCEQSYYLLIKAAKQKGDASAKQKEIRSYDPGYGRSWATSAAAEADRPNFKAWVDSGCIGMSPAQQAATAASSSVTSSASSRQVPRNDGPERSSKRAKINHAWRAVLNLSARAFVTGAAVVATVAMAFAARAYGPRAAGHGVAGALSLHEREQAPSAAAGSQRGAGERAGGRVGALPGSLPRCCCGR